MGDHSIILSTLFSFVLLVNPSRIFQIVPSVIHNFVLQFLSVIAVE